MKEKLRSTEVWFKILLLFVFSGAYLLAVPFPHESRQFPQLLAVVSLALTIAALAADFLRGQASAGEIGAVDDTELRVLDGQAPKERRRRFIQAWAIILVATAAAFLGGFLLGAALIFAGFGVAFGHRENLLRNLIVAAAMTAGVYVVFGRIMAVPVLDGLLW